MPIVIDYEPIAEPIPVSTLIERIGILLVDEDHERWPVEELIHWINEALSEILNRRPAAFGTTSVHSLIAGAKQNAPSGSAVMLDVVCNIDDDGSTRGRVIRRTDRQLMDDVDPDWQTRTARSQIRQYMFDDRVPTIFYCYPPAIAGTKVEVMHAPIPTQVENESDTIDIGVEYSAAIVNYVCWRCNSKDDEDAEAGKAGTFYQAFEAAIGVKSASSAASSPNQPNNSV